MPDRFEDVAGRLKDVLKIETRNPEPRYISCVPVSRPVQTATITLPELKFWRCELTAFSRTQNLYFVASSANIFVFQPSYPDQSPGLPLLRISSAPSARHLLGFIEPHDSHAINRLHVDYLGRKEILLTAHDDGDIVGYYISTIQAFIEARKSQGHITCDVNANIKPFFRINVQASAWGLAVHRQARLIAISANSHKVTVIAFKLIGEKSREEESAMPLDSNNEAPYRTIILHASNNIPSVAFNNTGTDRAGRWLVSSVIDGYTYLWDLDHPDKPSRKVALGYCKREDHRTSGDHNELCSDFEHGAWSAIFVDTRFCHHSASIRDAFGGPPCIRGYTDFWDITFSAPDGAPKRYFDGAHPAIIARAVDFGLGSVLDAFDHDHAGPPANNFEDDSDEDTFLEDADVAFASSHSDDDDDPHPLMSVSDESDSAVDHVSSGNIISNHYINLYAGPDNEVMATSYEDDPDSFISIESQDIQMPTEKKSIRPKGFYITDELAGHDDDHTTSIDEESRELPPLAILTRSEGFLLQPYDIWPVRRRYLRKDPIITIHRPCATSHAYMQSYYLQQQHSVLSNKYTLHIPELGLLAVCDQIKCAIFSITAVPVWMNGKDQPPVYGLRKEYVLPLKRELTPSMNTRVRANWILGIAAGPVQGDLDTTDDDGEVEDDASERPVERARRWRLFLYRQRGMVQAYELSRRKTGKELSVSDFTI